MDCLTGCAQQERPRKQAVLLTSILKQNRQMKTLIIAQMDACNINERSSVRGSKIRVVAVQICTAIQLQYLHWIVPLILVHLASTNYPLTLARQADQKHSLQKGGIFASKGSGSYTYSLLLLLMVAVASQTFVSLIVQGIPEAFGSMSSIAVWNPLPETANGLGSLCISLEMRCHPDSYVGAMPGCS